MPTQLNVHAYKFAQNLIENGSYVFDELGLWSEHQPDARQESFLLEKRGHKEYGKWYLGVDTDQAEGAKTRYKFACGDFKDVHRCGVVSAELRAGQYHYHDIEQAAAHLHGMIDGSYKSRA